MKGRKIADVHAPYAVTEAQSRGRRFDESPPEYRGEFQRDRDRIVHSSAFRRLEYKTQVFVNHEGDMYRTRLTHSLEVAQIGRAVARALGLNEDLTEAISLAHDLGHTPFGHAGQEALNRCMEEYGGFEHNLQSLRVVDELEQRYAAFPGLNLMFETREGILKHCSAKKAAQLGDVGRRFLDKHQPSLEAQVANLADEIAYNSHDIDDGLRAGLITIEQLCELELFREPYESVCSAYPDLSHRRTIHEVVRRIIGRQVSDLVETTSKRLEEARPEDVDEVRASDAALVAFSDGMRAKNLLLKRFLRRELYQHYRVRRMTVKAANIIEALFDAFMNDMRLLPPDQLGPVAGDGKPHDINIYARAVADYVAGMTDRYAIREHERVFNPRELT